VQRIDYCLYALFGRHQVIERTATVFVEFGGHVVERLRHLPKFPVVAEIEPLIVVMVGDLRDPLFQLVDRPQHNSRKTN